MEHEDDGREYRKADPAAPKSVAKRKHPVRRVLALVIALSHLVGAASSVHAIMNTRTSQGAIAWAVSLNTFPYLAVPAYWVFGRSQFQGYTIARRMELEKFSSVVAEAVAATNTYRLPPDFVHAAGVAAERLAGLPFLKGNSVDLLIDGDETFTSIFEGIDSAKKYVLFQYYIVHDDEIGREAKTRLIEKAKSGVRVKFLYDEIGCLDLPETYKDELRAAGVEVHDFGSQKGPRNRSQINFRNHRKVVVVDGHSAWIGGLNVGDEYLGRDPEFGNWRDTHARITGPAALGAQLSFAEDWYWASGQKLELDWTPVPSADGDIPVLIVPSGPADTIETASLMFVHAINSATERIWIATPYYVPDEAVITALQLAGLRGVDVRILIPEKTDSLPVHLATHSYFDGAARTGVKFYRYTDGFMHAKTMLIDRSVSNIGTANFDNRSFRLNFEITAVIADESFASEVEQMFEADFARSRQIGPDEYTAKPWWYRFAVGVARLTSPIL